MKNEKREITLNERDSLTDMLRAEKFLLLSYVDALSYALKKETRSAILEKMEKSAEEVLYLRDLIQGEDAED